MVLQNFLSVLKIIHKAKHNVDEVLCSNSLREVSNRIGCFSVKAHVDAYVV